LADLLNSIIIIESIGLKTVITIIIITMVKCIGSMYFRSDKSKTIFVIIHGLSVAIFESILLIMLGTMK
jgi:hypothetical protein